MPTFHQLTKNSRKPRRYKNKRIALNNCSQKRATCLKVHVITPRKPNSGLRKISRVIFTSNFKRVNTYIPGIGYNTLQKHFSVLVRGMQIKDRSHKIMKGNFNLKALVDHHHACSKYGFHTKKTLNGLPLGILLSQNFYFFSFDLEYQIMNFMITNDIIFDDFFRKCVLLSILFLLVIINWYLNVLSWFTENKQLSTLDKLNKLSPDLWYLFIRSRIWWVDLKNAIYSLPVKKILILIFFSLGLYNLFQLDFLTRIGDSCWLFWCCYWYILKWIGEVFDNETEQEWMFKNLPIFFNPFLLPTFVFMTWISTNLLGSAFTAMFDSILQLLFLISSAIYWLKNENSDIYYDPIEYEILNKRIDELKKTIEELEKSAATIKQMLKELEELDELYGIKKKRNKERFLLGMRILLKICMFILLCWLL